MSGASSGGDNSQANGTTATIVNCPQMRQSMKREINRLNSFYVNDQSLWPVPGVDPHMLALNGFFRLNDDRVQCPFCTGIISNWTPGMNPLEEHSRHFPLCPFIMSEDVGNVAIDEDPIRSPRSPFSHDVSGHGTSRLERSSPQIEQGGARSNNAKHLQELGVQLYSGPREPEMGAVEQREASFASDWDTWYPVSAQALAEAGFYYLGGNDIVKCFHCGIGLHEWEKDDDPWTEHAQKSPYCNFLKLNKNQTFIDQSRQNKMQIPISEEDVCRTVDEWFGSELVQQLVTLNLFSIDLIKAALNLRVYSHQQSFESFSQLYEAVTSLVNRPINNPPTESASIESLNLNIRQMDNRSTAQTSATNQSEANPSNAEQSPDDQTNDQSSSGEQIMVCPKGNEPPAHKPDNNSGSRLHCKICFHSDIEVVFLPCGHQLACRQCSQRLTDCPVCRKSIKGYVYTYFP